MSGEFFRVALLGALGALLIWAAITDLRARIISNRLNLAAAALAPLWWIACGLPLWPEIALQLLLGVIVFAAFAALFALGMMGGGDVKLLGALALWFPWPVLLSFIVLMAVVGGGVTVATIIDHKLRRREGQPEIPYGVAISISALWLIGERYLNHFA